MATEYFNDAWRIPNNKNQSLVSNYSMEFDGTNDFINCGNFAPFNVPHTKFSISLWCKSPNSFTDSGNLIESRLSYATPNGIAIEFISGTMYFRQTGSTFGKTIAEWGLNNTNWNHIVFAYDLTITSGNNVFVYINNATPPNRDIAATSQPATTADFKIGDGLRGNFDGQIDQVSIFNYTLSASQVATLYGGGTAVTNPMSLSPKPVAYYQLGDQTASNDTTEPTPPVQSYLVPNNSLQDYVFQTSPAGSPHISIPSITISEAATISIWVNIISFSGGTQQTFFGDQTNTKLVVNNQSGFIRVIYSGESGLGLKITTLVTSDFINKWHHIALVQNGGAATVYIDGNSEGIINPGTLRTPSFAAIGALAGGAATLNGFVSNAAIFSTNLPATGTESIASLYNNGTPPDLSSYSNLERWYKLNAQDTFDGTDWTIKDYANNQDGTSVRMTSANLVQSNLQHTSGYSPYALDFGGITAHLKTYTIPATTNTVTLSAWVKRTGASGQYAGVFGVRNSGGTPSFGLCWQISFGNNDNKIRFRTSADSSSGWQEVVQNDVMPDNTWHHVAGVADGTNLKIYINGALQTDTKTQTNGTLQSPTSNIFFGMQSAASSPFNGQLSNCARWNIGLTQAQVTEIYNQGVPSNLNNFSGTTPIGWWQLGSNSSFEGNDWTCLDEIGTDYADSGTTAMTEDDIVNGVGYSGNGLGTSSIEIVGDAPYSTANGLSENMDVLDRTTDVPS